MNLRSFVVLPLALLPLACGSAPAEATKQKPVDAMKSDASAGARDAGRGVETGAPGRDAGPPRDGAPPRVGGGARVLLGAYTDQGNDQPMAFPALEAAIGRPLAIENQREPWVTSFDQADEQADLAAGVTPLISWTLELGGGGCATLDAIAGGTYDEQLAKQATIVAGMKKAVLIRFYKEFTDSSIDACAYGTSHPAQDPGTYGPMFVAAWQKVVTIFRAGGASNAQWVWGPSANLFTKKDGEADGKTWPYFYPGDGYVDWLANDNYNKKAKPARYDQDVDILNWYAEMSTKGKPLMQSETGAGYDAKKSPDAETEWITSAYASLPTTFPAIRAFVYWDAQGQQDYRLQGAGLDAFRAMADDPYFQATE